MCLVFSTNYNTLLAFLHDNYDSSKQLTYTSHTSEVNCCMLDQLFFIPSLTMDANLQKLG